MISANRHLYSTTTAVLLATTIILGGCATSGAPNESASESAPVSASESIPKTVGHTQPGQLSQFVESQPEKLKPFFQTLDRDGGRNAVLNFNYLGLAAMEIGEYQTAEKAFDESIKRIDSIYADNENAKKAKSLWNEEKSKDWKGESYERAMTYFYRGLLYIRAGDYDNGAASFRAADYQDTQAEQEVFQGDFGLMPYMAAWAQNCHGNKVLANDLLKQAKTKDSKYAPAFSSLPLDANFIVVVDSGAGPSKIGTGQYKELLQIEDRKGGKDTSVKVESKAGEQIQLSDTLEAGDVYFQASTRGGRQFDGVLNGKAQWKDGTNAVGEVATTVGSVALMAGALSNNNSMANFGMFGSLFGIIAKASAANMTPAADTRNWGSLPRNIELASTTLTVPNLLPKLSLRYDNGNGNGEVTKPITFMGQNGSCGMAWARTRSSFTPAEGGIANLGNNPKTDNKSVPVKNPGFTTEYVSLPDSFNF